MVVRSIEYVAHQISGDVPGNIRQVLSICRQLHLDNPDLLPIAPYVPCLLYLDDHAQTERELGMDADKAMIDAVCRRMRIHGSRLSSGVVSEARHFRDIGRAIILQNPALEEDLKRALEGYPYVIEPFSLRPEILKETDSVLARMYPLK